jgi:hypothetical protein
VLYLGVPRHESIFIETHELGKSSGHLYHVIGNILDGMKYEDRRYKIPPIPHPSRRCPSSALYFLPIFLASRPFAGQSRSQADSWICAADALIRANPFDDAENGQPTPFRLYISRALSDK